MSNEFAALEDHVSALTDEIASKIAEAEQWSHRAAIAEARVQELKEANKTIIKEDGVVVSRQAARMQELTEALREIAQRASDAWARGRARRALGEK